MIDDRVAAADRRQRGDQPRVDQPAAQVGALHRGEHDPRVAQHLADRRRSAAAAARRGGAAVDGGLGEHLGDVPVGVVVGEQRGAVVPGAPLARR